MSFIFENLKIWQKALELSQSVNELTKCFPVDERFALASQMKRAADSVSLNIAEGSTGQTKKEFKRFLAISLRSCVEVVGCIYLARDRQLITSEQFDTLYQELLILTKMIQSFRNSLNETN